MPEKRIFARINSSFRKLRKRAPLILFTFCAINALWAVVGTWTISFGGESYVYFDARHQSGIYSNRGYLILAVRDSRFMATGLSPASAAPFRQPFPWSITANLSVGPNMHLWKWSNGIVDDHPRTILPGLLINWQDTQSDWHNRGIAIHWALLLALSSILPIISWMRGRTRPRPGLCAGCGYDLRATPDQCPECGAVPKPPSAASRPWT